MLNNYYNFASKNFYFKKIFIFLNITIKFFIFNNQKILLLTKNSNSYYFLCPTFLDLIYNQNYLYLTLKSHLNNLKYKQLFFFLSQVTICLKQLTQMCSLTFLIRGVGLKVNLLNSLHLSLKFGYSHLIFLIVPDIIKIAIFKKKVILSSFNKITLGNFCNVIYKYRPINIFTGKGLLKKKRFFKLKAYTKKI
jgi:ribosomal protein L6P/L9E